MKKELQIMIAAAAFTASAGAQNNLTLSTDETVTTDDCTVILRSGAAVEFTTDGLTAEVEGNPDGCLATGLSGGGAVALDAAPFDEVEENTTVTLTWDVPANHDCTLTRNGATFFSDSQIDANTSTTDTVSGDVTYRMNCTNSKTDPQFAPGTESAFATALVTVLNSGGGGGGGVGEFCDAQPTGLSRVDPVEFLSNRLIEGSSSTYEGIWGPWGDSSSTIYVEMSNGQYASLPFVISNTRSDDFAIMVWDQISESPEQVRVSVSTCIGGPLQETSVPQSGNNSCYFQGSGVSGGFNMKAIESTSGCILQAGVQYFFNIAFVDANGNAGCTLPGGNCAWNVSEN
ncbi:MAG: hypothetical protein R3200_00395 [Xanthomonadales bacterium]|nr:hypothetical protein [Xanthomonadales bacterium]